MYYEACSLQCCWTGLYYIEGPIHIHERGRIFETLQWCCYWLFLKVYIFSFTFFCYLNNTEGEENVIIFPHFIWKLSYVPHWFCHGLIFYFFARWEMHLGCMATIIVCHQKMTTFIRERSARSIHGWCRSALLHCTALRCFFQEHKVRPVSMSVLTFFKRYPNTIHTLVTVLGNPLIAHDKWEIMGFGIQRSKWPLTEPRSRTCSLNLFMQASSYSMCLWPNTQASNQSESFEELLEDTGAVCSERSDCPFDNNSGLS